MTVQEQIVQEVTDLGILPMSLMDYLCLWGTDPEVILARLQSLRALKDMDAREAEIAAEVARLSLSPARMLAVVQSVGTDRAAILAALKEMEP